MPENTGLLLIGCGLPRTGTLSTKTALDILLPGKCHHIVSAFDHQEEWEHILSGKASDEEFRKFFASNNYTAAVDGPFCFVYERALTVFPNAKVLLTIRSPETWNRSMKETVIKELFLPFPASLFNYLRIFKDYLGLFPVLAKALAGDKNNIEMGTRVRDGTGIAFYHQWVNQVEQSVPAEKLLKFSVTEGWEPLCRFLDVPIPREPFPRVNSTQDFIGRLEKRKRRSWLLLYEFVSIPLLVGLLHFVLNK